MITAVSAGPALDVTYEVDDLVLGGTHRPTAVHRRAGGKAVNLARAAAAMGAEAQVVVPLPAAQHAFFADQLAAEGVAVHAVDVAAELRTCVSVACGTSGVMTEVYEHPAPLSADEERRFVSAVATRGADGWVALSGAVPGAALVDALLAAGSPAAQAVDTSGAALAAAVARRPRVVKVNRHEAITWYGDAAPVEDLAHALQDGTGGYVVVTDSVHGAVGCDGSSTWRLGPAGEPGGFAQGSGDSFLGGLLATLDLGGDWPDALRLAAGCAAANAQVPGAGRFDPDLARRLAESVRLDSL